MDANCSRMAHSSPVEVSGPEEEATSGLGRRYCGRVRPRDFIIRMSDRPMVSGALMLDMRYVYAAVPIAFTLQAVRLVERWWRIFTKRDPLVVPSEEVF